MAGGLGNKFWPRSTEQSPKQFGYFLGDGTMIQNTFDRLKNYFPLEDIFVVTSEIWRNSVREQLPDAKPENFIFEPFARNTAACVTLTSFTLRKRYSQDIVIMAFPADQVIFNLGEFYSSLDLACKAAYTLGAIVTIGVEPTRAETHFGYIQVQDEPNGAGDLFAQGVRKCSTFAEKPDKGTARRFVESGDFLWNSGIFVARLDAFLAALDKHMPDHSDLFKKLENNLRPEEFSEEAANIYRQINSISLDYGILEKANNVYCVLATFFWSDLATWDELYMLSRKDARFNVIEGEVITVDTSRSLIIAGGKLIGIIGMEDVIVVDSDEALLICKRGQSNDVKELIDFMRRKHISRHL